MDTNEPEPQKKVCTENKLRLPQKFEIAIIDHEAPKRFFKLKTLQNLLLWIFCKNQVNPLWLTVSNKHLIRCGVVLNLPFNLEHSAYLSSLAAEDKLVTFTQQEQGKPNFWQSLFYSKYHEEPSFQTQKRVKAVEGETYEQRVYSRFDYFSLTLEQLKVNLYPLDTKIYHDYKQFSPLKRDGVDVYAVDCEMVRTEQGLELARVSIVDYEYRVVMDEFVKPANAVLDHNTQYSGITEEKLKDVTTTLADIQGKLCALFGRDTILIGHSLENDLNALQLIHHKIVDTSVLYLTESSRKLSLKNLAFKYFSLSIQKDSHDSIEDAKMAMALARYRIEILEQFPAACFPIQSSPTPDVLVQLTKSGVVHIVESKSQVEQLIKYGVTYEEAEEVNDERKLQRMGDLLRQRNANAPNPKFIFGQLSGEVEKFDELFSGMFGHAPPSTCKSDE